MNTERIAEVKALLGVPHDEPIFVIRAQDKAACATLIDYADNSERVGASKQFVDAIDGIADDFEKFAIEHPDRQKVPD